MPVGAEFYTDSGVVQIDENYVCLALRYTGSATVVNRHPASLNTSSYIAKTVDITVTADSPIMAIAGPGSYGVIATIKSGNNWTFRVIGFDHNPTFQYFIYDKPTSSPSGAGMEVYDASGNVVFSSLWRPLEVVGYSGSNQGPYISLPTGRQYATINNATISLWENSEHFTNQEIWTYWTYDLTTAFAGSSTIGGTNNGAGWVSAAIAGGVNQGPTSPVYPTGDLGGWGAGTSMLVVDVTDIIGAPVTIGGPSVAVNATTRTANGTGTGTTITSAVTATASGGQGAPYSYQWDKISGEPGIVAYGATNTASLRTQVVNQIAGSTMVSKWRCKGTDSQGLANFSPEVTMTHIQGAADRTPDAVSVPNLSVVTNDNTAWSNDGWVQITGINQPIVVRFTRGNQVDSGGIFTRRLYIYHSTSGTGGPWTEYFVGTGSNTFADITVNNGDWLLIRAYFDTTAGRGDTSFTGYMTNQTLGYQMASFNVSATVDADNNYNNAPVDDYTPDNITLPTMNVSSNDPDVSFSTTSFGTYTVTGINKPITVRFERYDYSGNLDALHVDVFTMPPGSSSWTHHGYYNAHAAGLAYLDIPNVVNGTKIAYNPHAITNSGRKSASCRFVLWALQTNTQFATSAGCNFVVDADDNYNKGTGANGAFTMPNLVGNSDGQGYAYGIVVGPVMTANETLTISTTSPTGINTNRFATFTIASDGGTALNFNWGANAVRTGVVSVLAGKTLNASIDLNNTGSTGIRSIAFTVTIKNSAGTTLSTFNVSASASASGGIDV